MDKVYVVDGPNKGASFDLNDGTTTVGRAPDNDILISDKGFPGTMANSLKEMKSSSL